MSQFSAAATLELWAAVEPRDRLDRPIVLAALAEGAGSEPEAMATLPLGSRDARLLQLHRRLGGSTLDVVAPCPACGTAVEAAIDVAALLAAGAAAVPVERLEVAGYVVAWRSPNTRDLKAAAGAGNAAAAETLLLERCVIEVSGRDGLTEARSLPPPVRRALAEAMAAADPLAEVVADVDCPACGLTFAADVDIGGYVWTEVRRRAWRALNDVHVLAAAYGWSESAILALDEGRRAAYLELVDAGSR